MRSRDLLFPVSALSVLIVLPTAVLAFTAPADPAAADLSVSIPLLEEARFVPLVQGEPTIEEERSALSGLPGRWEVRWNRLTGTPHRIFGSGVDLAPGGLARESDVDRISRDFITSHPELAGADAIDLQLLAVVHAAGHWSAIYEQAHFGVPIEGALIVFLYSDQGRLLMFGSDAYRTLAVAKSPAVTAAAALAAGARGLPAPTITRQPELRILPVPGAAAGSDEIAVTHHLAYRMVLETVAPRGRWITWVDAATGDVLWRTNDIRYLEITGNSTAGIEDFGYCDGVTPLPLKDLTVNVSGVPSVHTNTAGDYSATVPDATTRTVTAQLRGRRVRLQNNAGVNASFSGETTPGVPLAITWANAQFDERDVYVHTTRSFDFIRSIDPLTPLGALDGQLLANVSLNATCNAFWDGSSINFYREGDGCANTGRIGDVVIHEYGHGVSQFVYQPLGVPGDMGEGNSDIIANHMTERSLIGDGFNLGQCGQGIRNCDNTLRYPDDVVGQEIHAAGRVICGFDWDVRKNLEVLNPVIFASHSDSLWHYTRLLTKPQNQPDQVAVYFFLDDDDADITNGSPHYDALCPAAEKHGFAPPGPASVVPVTITHSPLHSTTDESNPRAVDATMISTAGAIDLNQTRLHYRVNAGPEVDVAMAATGTPNQYRGFIPAQPTGSRVTYTITTADVAGNGGAHPPQRCFPEVPNGVEVYHGATILDELEAESGWTVGAPGDNATTGIWERVDPVGTAAQPENDRTPAPGTMCFVTGQGLPGGGLGDDDVDGGRTTLLSPVYDLSTLPSADLLYHRWYSNDTGAAPNSDFWVVDVSNDGGATWVNVENTNVTDQTWREVRINLNQIFGVRPDRLRVRFIASDEGEGSLVEAGIDEFMILGSEIPNAIDDAPAGAVPARFTLGPLVPNPFNPATMIHFTVPEPAAVSLVIYDVDGRLVRALASGSRYEAGTHGLRWDGRDSGGGRVSSGVYYVRLAAGDFAETQKIVMVK